MLTTLAVRVSHLRFSFTVKGVGTPAGGQTQKLGPAAESCVPESQLVNFEDLVPLQAAQSTPGRGRRTPPEMRRADPPAAC